MVRNHEYRIRQLTALLFDVADGAEKAQVCERLMRMIEEELTLQASEVGKETWFRYIDEQVRHHDWKRRLFGKKSNYRKAKRKYGDKCRDCKWNPDFKKPLSPVEQEGLPGVTQGNEAGKLVAEILFDLNVVLERGADGRLRVVGIKEAKLHDRA